MKLGPRSEKHRVCLVTVRAHNGLNRVQGKTSFNMVIEVEQLDLETLLRKIWRKRKRPSERGEGDQWQIDQKV